MKPWPKLCALFFAALALSAARAGEIENYYGVETITPPAGVVPECGGIGFLPDGRLVAVFDHGEVYFYTPATKAWKKFAEGLHTPLGVLPISEREIIVCQRPELTRLLDTTGSGVADRYESLSSHWGLSGNYHEFAYGPVRDPQGNFYVALNSASGGGDARYEVRGQFKREGYDFDPKGMYSVVPYRGWVIKISPQGKITPIACGFRSPNGIALDPQGRVFVTDNQGDWVGTSKLHLVEPGKFYGQASGLVWRDDFKRPLPLGELDKIRTEGVILFPHAIMASSPGQPVFDLTGGKFGPFAGQMFVTEFNIPRLLRVMLEEVHGQTQGAVTTFFNGAPLKMGGIRLAFAPDGSLWTSQNGRPRAGDWLGGAGIQRVFWKGRVPLDVSRMHLTSQGFELTFTKPVDVATAANPQAYPGKRFYYLYHPEYGSPRMDIHPVGIGKVTVSADQRTVSFPVDALTPGFIYQFTLQGIKATDGSPLVNTLIAYTLNITQDGAVVQLPRPKPTGTSEGSGQDLMPDPGL